MNKQPHSLADLNSKWWYRLLKVGYIGLFGIMTLVMLIAIYDENEPDSLVVDHRIICTGGNHSTFQASRDKRIDLSGYSSSLGLESLSNAQRYTLRIACGEEEVRSSPREILDAKYNNDTLPSVEIEDIALTRGSWIEVLLYSVAYLIAVALLFEFGRRLFYYIVLGTWKPEN
ncbi:MAG TPA: hypothetical protein PK609_00265 [Candidatus Paceibacterota bacterium]|nr:hypothetical protein [Candidatus Paceibacterota bacterium]